MRQIFLNLIRAEALASGIKPTTIVQAVGQGHGVWDKWCSGASAPTIDTIEKVLAHINKRRKNRGIQKPIEFKVMPEDRDISLDSQEYVGHKSKPAQEAAS